MDTGELACKILDRMAELMEYTTMSPMAVMSELGEGDGNDLK